MSYDSIILSMMITKQIKGHSRILDYRMAVTAIYQTIVARHHACTPDDDAAAFLLFLFWFWFWMSG